MTPSSNPKMIFATQLTARFLHQLDSKWAEEESWLDSEEEKVVDFYWGMGWWLMGRFELGDWLTDKSIDVL